MQLLLVFFLLGNAIAGQGLRACLVRWDASYDAVSVPDPCRHCKDSNNTYTGYRLQDARADPPPHCHLDPGLGDFVSCLWCADPVADLIFCGVDWEKNLHTPGSNDQAVVCQNKDYFALQQIKAGETCEGKAHNATLTGSCLKFSDRLDRAVCLLSWVDGTWAKVYSRGSVCLNTGGLYPFVGYPRFESDPCEPGYIFESVSINQVCLDMTSNVCMRPWNAGAGYELVYDQELHCSFGDYSGFFLLNGSDCSAGQLAANTTCGVYLQAGNC